MALNTYLLLKSVGPVLHCGLTSSQIHGWASLYFYFLKLTINAIIFSLTPLVVSNWITFCFLLCFNPEVILGVSILRTPGPNS